MYLKSGVELFLYGDEMMSQQSRTGVIFSYDSNSIIGYFNFNHRYISSSKL